MTVETGPLTDEHKAEVLKFQDFAKTYGLRLGVLLCLVLAVAIGSKAYRQRTIRRNQEATQLLFQARSTGDLQGILERHGRTPSAPLALLKLAKGLYDSGDYAGAISRYDEFLNRFPEHPLKLGAELGKIYCLEAAGEDLEKAMQAFRRFSNENRKHFLVGQAVLGEARCLERLDKPEEARIVYENFIVNHPESIWVSEAEEGLALLTEAASSTER